MGQPYIQKVTIIQNWALLYWASIKGIGDNFLNVKNKFKYKKEKKKKLSFKNV